MGQWDYSNTPPGVKNYNAADAGTAVAPGHADPAVLTAVAPAHANPPALSNAVPGHTNPAALSNAAPNHTDPAALSAVAPGHVNPVALSAAAPGHSDPVANTNTPPQVLESDGTTPTGLPANMPSTFTPAFVELTGGGASLDTLNANAADAAAKKIVQGTVAGQLKSYQARIGADAQDLPGIVHPANHDAVNNPVVFVQL